MIHGMFLCVGCMCSVMREGMCKKCTYVCHTFDGLVGGIENVMRWTENTELSTPKNGN